MGIGIEHADRCLDLPETAPERQIDGRKGPCFPGRCAGEADCAIVLRDRAALDIGRQEFRPPGLEGTASGVCFQDRLPAGPVRPPPGRLLRHGQFAHETGHPPDGQGRHRPSRHHRRIDHQQTGRQRGVQGGNIGAHRPAHRMADQNGLLPESRQHTRQVADIGRPGAQPARVRRHGGQTMAPQVQRPHRIAAGQLLQDRAIGLGIHAGRMGEMDEGRGARRRPPGKAGENAALGRDLDTGKQGQDAPSLFFLFYHPVCHASPSIDSLCCDALDSRHQSAT